MKKLFLAFMAVATIAMIGCKKEEPTNNEEGGGQEQGGGGQGGGTTDDIPDGYVQILIQVPDGEECHGIYMKGSLNGSDWSGENTYIGLEEAGVEADKAIKFERIADKSDFFKANFKLGPDGLQGAVCQKYPNDGSWQGKSRKVKLIEDKTTLEGAKDLELPQFHIPAGTKPGVLALKIGGWENSECVKANEAGQAIFTMKSKVALPEGTKVGITGVNLEGKGNWDHANPIIMTKQSDGSYMAINNVGANCVYKYVLCFADEAGFNDKHGHVIDGDAGNLVMPVSLAPVDEVDEWLEFDKHYLPEDFDKEKHVWGIIGAAVGGWDVANDVVMSYAADEGDYYVAEAANVDMAAGNFKLRENKAWDVNLGWSAFNGNIAGDADNFEDAGADDNINCKVATKYSKVTFKFKWNGSKVTDYTLTFTK